MLLVKEVNEKIDFAPVAAKLKSPSVYYSMVHADGVLHTYSSGYSDVMRKTRPDAQTQYALFSATKPFTAIAILQLQEAGLLHLDDPVNKYLPEYAVLQGVTIRQLLAHQSGLNNPLPLRWIHLATEDETFDYQLFSQRSLQRLAKQVYAPGEKSRYSNLNYLTLGEIIMRVSGEPYQTYVLHHLLSENSSISFRWNADNTATGYHRNDLFSAGLLGLLLDKKKYTAKADGQYLAFQPSYLNGSAYGGLIANAVGLQSFLRQLLHPTTSLLTSESRQLLFEEQRLANGKPSGKALGWFTGNLQGNSYVAHAGGGGGFYSEIRVYPTLGLASLLLTNVSGFSDQRRLDWFDAPLLLSGAIN
ncbi:MAG: serine hydrolase domain-containing protein [Saprospiraceae bacterium]